MAFSDKRLRRAAEHGLAITTRHGGQRIGFRKPSLHCFSAVLLLISLNGCASLLSDNAYQVMLDSQPSGADFTITRRTGERVAAGTTPGTLRLDSSAGFFRGERYEIILQARGRAQTRAVLSARIDTTWLLNYFILALPVGFLGAVVIDPFTGAMFRLPTSLTVQLPAALPEPPQPGLPARPADTAEP